MATATFDKRIIIDQKDAEFLIHELEKKPIGPPKLAESFKEENERKINKCLSSFVK